MGLLDKANPQATPETVRRAALMFAVISAIGYAIACYWSPLLRQYFLILFPLITCAGAALGALMEWQLGPDFDMADVVYRMEKAYDVRLDHVELVSLLTVGDLLSAIREAVASQHPANSETVLGEHFRQRFRVEIASALGIDEDEVTDSARFYFDIP